jgi:hypothetical protein
MLLKPSTSEVEVVQESSGHTVSRITTEVFTQVITEGKCTTQKYENIYLNFLI